jgi:hypothetical protein
MQTKKNKGADLETIFSDKEINAGIGKLKYFIWTLRIVAAACLVYLALGVHGDLVVFSDIKIRLPFVYTFANHQTCMEQGSEALVLPILANLALWVRCSASYYLFLGFLYAELIPQLTSILFFVLGMVFNILEIGQIAKEPIKIVPYALTMLILSGIYIAGTYFWQRRAMYRLYNNKQSNMVKRPRQIIIGVISMFAIYLTANFMPHMGEQNIYDGKGIGITREAKEEVLNVGAMSLSYDGEKILLVKTHPKYGLERAKRNYQQETIHAYDVKDVKQIFSVKGLAMDSAAVFAPNSDRLILVSKEPATDDKKNFAEFSIDNESYGKQEEPIWNENGLTVDRGSATKIEFSHDGILFAVVSKKDGNCFVDVWDYQNKSLLTSEKVPAQEFRFLSWLNNNEYISWQKFHGKEGIFVSRVKANENVQKVFKADLTRIIEEKYKEIGKNKGFYNVFIKQNPHTEEIVMAINGRYGVLESLDSYIYVIDKNTWKIKRKYEQETYVIDFFMPNKSNIVLVETRSPGSSKLSYLTILSESNKSKRSYKNIGKWFDASFKSAEIIGDKVKLSYHLTDDNETYAALIQDNKIFISFRDIYIVDLEDLGIKASK